MRNLEHFIEQEGRYKIGNGESFIIGRSRRMLEVYDLIERLADLPINILLSGETGTGKTLIAKALHYNSSVFRERPFVEVNCPGINQGIAESEFFGHRKGAFTGASGDRTGYFEEADSGTLFLDEVGELSSGMQTKLLFPLQEGSIVRVGETKKRQVSVRVISATNKELSEEIRERRFREDLFHRLNAFPIEVPSLRERPEDIPLIASYFIQRFNAKFGRGVQGFTPEAQEMLLLYQWGGNIRELENVVQKAVVLREEGLIRPADIGFDLTSVAVTERRRYLHGPIGTLQDARREAERDYLTSLMSLTQGNVGAAATKAGMPGRTFYRLLGRHGLTRSHFFDGNGHGEEATEDGYHGKDQTPDMVVPLPEDSLGEVSRNLGSEVEGTAEGTLGRDLDEEKTNHLESREGRESGVQADLGDQRSQGEGQQLEQRLHDAPAIGQETDLGDQQGGIRIGDDAHKSITDARPLTLPEEAGARRKSNGKGDGQKRSLVYSGESQEEGIRKVISIYQPEFNRRFLQRGVAERIFQGNYVVLSGHNTYCEAKVNAEYLAKELGLPREKARRELENVPPELIQRNGSQASVSPFTALFMIGLPLDGRQSLFLGELEKYLCLDRNNDDTIIAYMRESRLLEPGELEPFQMSAPRFNELYQGLGWRFSGVMGGKESREGLMREQGFIDTTNYVALASQEGVDSKSAYRAIGHKLKTDAVFGMVPSRVAHQVIEELKTSQGK